MMTEPASCRDERVVHTVGHSTRDINSFLELLALHDIEFLVDIRRWPSSRRFPQFNREALARSLEARGVGYLWVEALGGYRRPAPDSPNTEWRVGAFRAYADYMLTDEFAAVYESVERLATENRIVLMCAEAVPWRCHRRILSDAFVVRDWTVRHIVDGRCEPHALPEFAEVDGFRIFYRRSPTLF